MEFQMMHQSKWHKDVTAERVMNGAVREMTGLDNPGFCLACGREADGCEPDAQRYTCESCGAKQVYGAAELLMCVA
jgi:hypothetical protein